jgi:hypothetical protein
MFTVQRLIPNELEDLATYVLLEQRCHLGGVICETGT